MRENGIKRGVGGGRVGKEGGWAERGKKQGWYRGKKVGSCGNCRGGGGGGRGVEREGTLLAAKHSGGEEGKAGVDRARRVNLSIRGSMGMREGGGGRMVQGPKGSKRRKIRPRSGRSMARKRVEAAIDHYNARIEYRASCIGGARIVTSRDRTGDIGAKHTRKGRKREEREIYAALFRNFGVSR